MKPCGVVTLTTDFGLQDGYVGAMKGVLLGLAPQVRLVDITHLVPAHDVRAGAYLLESAASYFPVGTIHLAVVDPGVGSARAAVALRNDRAWYVGPDNGLLAHSVGESMEQLVRVEQAPGAPTRLGHTFDGRDLFAPAAAFLANGGRLEDLGPPLSRLQRLEMPQVKLAGFGVEGQVIHVDSFGNLITNIRESDLPEETRTVRVRAEGLTVEGPVRCYADVAAGTCCALIGSRGLLEVAVAQGSAAEKLGLRRGSTVVCIWG